MTKTMTTAKQGLTVQDLMQCDVRTVFPETLALRAAEAMVRSGIRHLVVTDVNRKVVGVFTERDALKHFSPWLTRASRTTEPPPRCNVGEFMSMPPITVTPDTPVREAAGILGSKRIGCLPVVDGEGGLVGILTAVDLLMAVAGSQLLRATEEFERFAPPAVLCENGELNLPKEYVAELKFDSAVLAYAPERRQIAVKLFLTGKDEESLVGARRVKLAEEHVVIPAKDLLDYHRISFRGELTVGKDEKTGYLVFSPRTSKGTRGHSAAKNHSGFPFPGS